MSIRSLVLAAAALAVASTAAGGEQTGFIRKTFTDAEGSRSTYVIFVPHNYNAKKEVPVILFLHGKGEVEGSKSRPFTVGLGPHIKKQDKTFPFLVVFPRADKSGWKAKGPNAARALAILDKTLKQYKTDRRRVYLTGVSMGGGGTWNVAARRPGRWAAIVPICGLGNPAEAETIKDIPCWVFHGAGDRTIPVTASRKMVAALKEAGGKPKYTEYPKARHNCWDQAYANPDLWTWLAAQKKKGPSPSIEKESHEDNRARRP